MLMLLSKIRRTMLKHPHYTVVLFIIVQATVLQFFRDPFSKAQYTVQQPPPTRFYSFDSPIIDYPYGNIDDLSSLLDNDEVLFVMFYAPWSVTSNDARKEFEKAATYLENEIQFVAVNCWYSYGICRQRNTFPSFPIFYFYITGFDGFKYNGLLKADYMVQFVEQMLNPLTYITSQDNLAMFIAKHDTSVIAYYEFASSPEPPAFDQFYLASLQMIEADPKNVVRFGVITDSALAKQLSLTDIPSIALIRSLNSTLKFLHPTNLTSTWLVQWILAHRQQPALKWLLPSGVKSLMLSLELKRGPAILLFLPAKPKSSVEHQHFSLFRHLALNYHNCNKTSFVNDLIMSDLYRLTLDSRRNDLLNYFCSQLPPPSIDDEIERNSRRRSRNLYHTKKMCCECVAVGQCDVCVESHHSNPFTSQGSVCQFLPLAIQSFLHSNRSFNISTDPSLCIEFMISYSPNSHVTACCRASDSHKIPRRVKKWFEITSTNSHRDDSTSSPQSSRNLRKQCNQRLQLNDNGWTFETSQRFPTEPFHYTGDFIGSACHTNRTLRFYAMDINNSFIFAEGLGFQKDDKKTFVVLVNIKEEAVYAMMKDVTENNIMSLMHDYSSNALSAHHRSTVPVQEEEAKESKESIHVVEVTSRTFNDVVINNDKDVLLLYYAPWCGFCAGFTHIYLSLARYFRSAKNLVFTRINADRNDVRWQFTVTEYPTLIFFPSQNKANSIKFPGHLAKTLPNLIRFILRWSTALDLFDSGLNICDGACRAANINASSTKINRLSNDINFLSQELDRVHQRRLQIEFRSSQDSVNEITFQGLKDDELILQRRLFKAELQRDNARYLNSVLHRPSTRQFVERHKLVSLMQQNVLYKTRLKTYLQDKPIDEPASDRSDNS